VAEERRSPLVSLLFLLLFFSAVAESETKRGRQTLVAQAREMLSRGLKPADQPRATELILAFLSGYAPPGAETSTPAWWWAYVGGGFLVCVLASFPPRTVIGIVKGASSVERWRRWIKFMSFTLPVTIGFFGFARPLFRDHLKHWF
jgi:hypothetical protein